jgi:hypothetical protein
MIGVQVACFYVNEQPMMDQNDYVVHCIYEPIKPCAMCLILPLLMNFDQGVINEPNTHGKLSQMCTQNKLFVQVWAIRSHNQVYH